MRRHAWPPAGLHHQPGKQGRAAVAGLAAATMAPGGRAGPTVLPGRTIRRSAGQLPLLLMVVGLLPAP